MSASVVRRVSLLRGERAEHVPGLAHQVDADEAWRQVGDGPADIAGAQRQERCWWPA